MSNKHLTHQEELELSHYIADIYKQSQQLSMTEFREYCLDSLKTFIEFEGALWLSRRNHEAAFTNLDTFNYHLPENFLENYNEFISKEKIEEDPLGAYAIANPNTTFNLREIFANKEEFLNSPLYAHHCSKFNQSDTLTGLYTTTFDNRINVVALYRFNSFTLFTEKEKQIKALLDPHYFEAMSMNIIFNFYRQQQSNGMCKGIADLQGNIIEAEDAFLKQLVKHNHNNTTTVALPALSVDKPITYQLADGFSISLRLKDTLVLIETLKESDEFTLLTPKQIEVCELLKQGLTDKEIATNLNVSPYTVSNHLKNIYKRLNTKNRVSTLAYISTL